MDDEDISTSSVCYSWPEEDHTPTTEQEIRGFYSYQVAAEVFAVVGVGAFLPVTLEQLARENGVLYSDRTTPCVVKAASIASQILLKRAEESSRDPGQCLVHVFGANFTTASFALYTFSAAVLCQALTLVSVSAFADYGDNRKTLLLTFGTMGAIVSMSFMFVVPSIYLVAAFLTIVGVTCLGCSFVVLNSFLPLLASNHPSVQQANKEHSLGFPERKNHDDEALKVSTSISSTAVGLGYTAALFVQVLGIGILVVTKVLFGDSISATLPLRLILLLSGLWWLAFMVPTAMWLRKRPGPRLLDQMSSRIGRSKLGIFFAYVHFAWRSLFQTLKIAFQLKQMVIYLFAWFILSDAQATVGGTAVLFARTELKIGNIGIAMLSITVMVSGVVGAAIIPRISARMKWNSGRTIICCLLLEALIPLYGLLGYLPFIQSWGFGGLQQWWEIYPCALIHGLVLAGLSSFCRSLFGSLVPPGYEAAFYALYAITDKGSSAIGPAVAGRIVDATGHLRPVFWFLLVLVTLPIPLVRWTDANQGQIDARKMAVKLKEQRGASVQMRAMQQRDEAEGLMRGIE